MEVADRTDDAHEANGEWFAGSLLHWHVVSEETGGAFALGEALIRPGGEPPLHVHAREDETFYVLEGEITFQRGHERIDAGAGDAVFMPRGRPARLRRAAPTRPACFRCSRPGASRRRSAP